MPKRSERNRFDPKAFETNPFEDYDPKDIYRIIQWGNNPKNIYDIEADESLVGLGQLAAYKYTGNYNYLTNSMYYLAIGSNTNYIYFLPFVNNKPIKKVPSLKSNWLKRCKVYQVDYLSKKGKQKEPLYYYHKHEKPYPVLYTFQDIGLLVPSNNKGVKSYAVIKEGIVG